MDRLLRTIACLLLALAVSSVSMTASAHGVVVVREAVEHSPSALSEVPCSDCGSHRLRVCAQSCAVSAESPESGLPDLELVSGTGHPPYRAAILRGLYAEPLHSPPIS